MKLSLFLMSTATAGIVLSSCNYSKNTSDADSLIMSGADMYIAPEGQSVERLRKLGFGAPSEDMSRLLDVSKLRVPVIVQSDSSHYDPVPLTDWLIRVKPGAAGAISFENAQAIVHGEDQLAFTIRGHAIEDGRWYFLDEPVKGGFDELLVSIDLLRTYEGEDHDYAADLLAGHEINLKSRLETINPQYTYEAPEPAATAAARVQGLKAIQLRFENAEATIMLRSQVSYEGMKAWDVLSCLGMKWGDMDLFHWQNKEVYGPDEYFSAWTSTDPGYFLPEQVKNGLMNPRDILFGFSIGRSVDPEGVFNTMLAAAKYAQQRLGGDLLNVEGKPLNEAEEQKKIKELVQQLQSVGITPGTSTALRMF